MAQTGRAMPSTCSGLAHMVCASRLCSLTASTNCSTWPTLEVRPRDRRTGHDRQELRTRISNCLCHTRPGIEERDLAEAASAQGLSRQRGSSIKGHELSPSGGYQNWLSFEFTAFPHWLGD
jgi:hypothetical protein